MTTFPSTWSTFDSSHDERISAGHRAYFRARFRNRLHAAVLSCFMDASCQDGLTKATISRRLGKRPEQITRWLGAPGNWTLDSISDLLLAMNCELNVATNSLCDRPASNAAHSWVMGDASTIAAGDSNVFDLKPIRQHAVQPSAKSTSGSFTTNTVSGLHVRQA